MGSIIGVISGDTRSLVYSSYHSRCVVFINGNEAQVAVSFGLGIGII